MRNTILVSSLAVPQYVASRQGDLALTFPASGWASTSRMASARGQAAHGAAGAALAQGQMVGETQVTPLGLAG